MKIIGHRGVKGIAAENTIVGIQKAIEHKVDEVEFDLRVTKDNVVILHHDASIKDANGTILNIADNTYNKLRTHKPDLATFKSVLQNIGHPIPYYVEVKPHEPIKPIVDIIDTYLGQGWKPEYFLLGSKNQKTLLELHDVLPQIEKIVIHPWSGVIAARRARQVNTKRISMNQIALWGVYISAMSKRGYKLSAYTLNNPLKAHRWKKHGLYAAITDFPDLMDE